MTFKNKKELERFLLKKCHNALLKAQEEVYRIIKDFLRQYYLDYDPTIYERTYQLLQSLVQSRIVSDGKGYKAEVYFNYDGLNYTDGANPSGKQVMDAAAVGLHGAKGLLVMGGEKDISIWNDPIKILDAKAIEILKNMLIAEGISIK